MAPNLTRAAATCSTAELEGIIRHGVRPDGPSLLGMPSQAFNRLRDDNITRIIAFIRSVPAAHGPGPSVSVGPLGHLGLITGKFKTSATLVEAVTPAPAVADSFAEASHAAHTICTECHGMDLGGEQEFGVPPLAIAATYALPEFETLMHRQGVWRPRTQTHVGASARPVYTLLAGGSRGVVHLPALARRTGHHIRPVRLRTADGM